MTNPPPGAAWPPCWRSLALLGALVAVGFAVIRGDAWRLPLVLVAVAAAVVGLWYALSRRGAPSWMGTLVAGAGLLTLVLVILTADYRGLPFVVAVALILVSASAARYALRPGRANPRLPRRRARRHHLPLNRS